MFWRLIKFIVNLFQFNRTNWRAVALCFLAATVFWLFNAFNQTYSTNIRFPLQFEFDEQRYTQSQPLPTSLYLNVTGNGWDLFRKHFGIKVPSLIIPLERPLEVKKIVASTLPPLLASQVGALTINFVVTDTLKIHIDERDEHKFRLVADASAIQYDKGMGRISPVVIQPDTIIIEGPKKLLHSMSDSILIVLPKKRVSENFRDEVEVYLENGEFLKRNPPLVEVLFEVGPITQLVRKIKVEKSAIRLIKQDSVEILFEIPTAQKKEFEEWDRMEVKRLPAPDGSLTWSVTAKPVYAKVLQMDSVILKNR